MGFVSPSKSCLNVVSLSFPQIAFFTLHLECTGMKASSCVAEPLISDRLSLVLVSITSGPLKTLQRLTFQKKSN